MICLFTHWEKCSVLISNSIKFFICCWCFYFCPFNFFFRFWWLFLSYLGILWLLAYGWAQENSTLKHWKGNVFWISVLCIWVMFGFVWIISREILFNIGHFGYLLLQIYLVWLLALWWWCRSKNKKLHSFRFCFSTFINQSHDLNTTNQSIFTDLYYEPARISNQGAKIWLIRLELNRSKFEHFRKSILDQNCLTTKHFNPIVLAT
jgi:hypothetical protein